MAARFCRGFAFRLASVLIFGFVLVLGLSGFLTSPASAQVPAAALTPAALAGKTLTLTIEGGEPPFAASGTYAVSLSVSGNVYVQPAAGAVPAAAGGWSHASGAPVADAVLTLGTYFADGAPATLSLLTDGFFELNRASLRAHQYGHFTLAEGPAVLPGNPPVITAQPAARTVELDAAATFSVSVQDPAGVSYQWRRNGVDLPGATAATLTLAAVRAADQGDYSVVVSTSGGGAVSSVAAALSIVPHAPEITAQPQDAAAYTGGTAVFTVGAKGFPEPSYQWKFAGQDIPGATAATLTRSGITAEMAGAYTCVITNSQGSATSGPAVLSLIPQPGALDSTFRNGSSLALNNGAATSLLQLPDGKLLVAGGFSQLDYSGARPGLFRLNADGSVDTTFNTELARTPAPGLTRVVAAPGGGQIYIAGAFTSVGSVTQRRIARLNADGSLDAGFAGLGPNDYTPADIAVQSDGKVIIAGEFTSVNGVSRSKIARLNADGTLDTGFNAAGMVISDNVSKVAVGADGRIWIAGKFITVGGVSRPRIAALTSTGALDTAFDPGLGFDAETKTLLFQPDGKLLVGGTQATYNGRASKCLTRLFPDGTQDTAFVPAAMTATTAAGVYALALQANGKIVAGGNFSKVDGVSRSCLTRLLPDGAADPAFNPGAGTGVTNPFVYDLAVQASGGIIVGGNFTQFSGTTRDKLARLTGDDTSLRAPVILAQPTGKSVIAGDPVTLTVLTGASPASWQWAKNGTDLPGEVFPSLSRASTSAADAGSYTVRISNAAGSVTSAAAGLTVDSSLIPGRLDPAFAPAAAVMSPVRALLPLSDGGLLTGGYSATLQSGIAKVSSAGLRDAAFPAKTAGTLHAMARQADGKILISGNFDGVNGVTKRLVARLNAEGTLDPSFDFYYNGTIYALAVQADGKILIGGDASGGLLRRLNSDGTDDSSFLLINQPNQAVSSLLLQPDGKILVTGSFSSIAGASRQGLARLNADGTHDTGFNPTNAALGFTPNTTLALQSGGRLLMAGTDGKIYRRNADGTADATFAYTPSDAGTQVVRMLVLPGDRILAVKYYASITDGGLPYRLIRLDANGTADTTFAAGTGANDQILALAQFADGRIAVGGAFSHFNSKTRPGMAILQAENPLAPVFTLQPVSRTALPGASTTFTAAASGTPAPAYQWRFNGFDIPGATGASLTVSPVSPSVTGSYTVAATSTEGVAVSSAATLGLARPPVIVTQPVSLTAPTNSTITFSAVAESAVQPLTWQWRKNGTAMPGFTAPSFVLANITAADEGDYDVIVTNADGFTTSVAARLTLGTGGGESGTFSGFLTAHGLNPATDGAATADPDHDGLDNLFEFIANSDPVTAGNRPLPELKTVPGKTPMLTWEFDRRTDFAAAGIVIEFSDSTLASWQTAVSGQNGITITTTPVNAALDRVTVSFPATQGRRFLRVAAR